MADTGNGSPQASHSVPYSVRATLRLAKRSKHARRRKATTDILNNTILALENSKNFLTLAPIPGLSNAVDGLVAVLEQVAKTRSNAEAVEALCREISKLTRMVEDVRGQVETRVKRFDAGSQERQDLISSLTRSDELRLRTERLNHDLGELYNMAQSLGKGNFFKRLWRSKRDEDTLRTIKEGTSYAILRFQVAGHLSIEGIVDGALKHVEDIHEELKAETARQQAYRDEQTLQALSSADSAGFRSVSNAAKSGYLPGTRQAVFKRLEEWVSSDKPVCFLIGPAGMGKSTIASEFCRRYEAELGASFFFRRGDPALGSTSHFFPTIAGQLANSRKELRSHIVEATRKHLENGRSQQMQYVARDLILDPLRVAADAGTLCRIFIVVDALDECNESNSQPELVPECLRLLISCALQYPAFFRLLVTSRPEPPHIEDELQREPALHDISTPLHLYRIEDRETVDRDISEMIRTRICSTTPGRMWHDENPTAVATLTHQSQGLFVYARTAADFVGRGAGAAQMSHRLDLLQSQGNAFGLGDLDQLYRVVLETAFPPADLDPKTGEQLRLILAWVALCQQPSGISPQEVANLSRIPCSVSLPMLQKLRSVIIFEHTDAGTTATPSEVEVVTSKFSSIHVTFRDFLVDSARCGSDYHLDAAAMHTRLAVDCLSKMHSTFKPEGIDDDYAMWYWDAHTVQANPTEELVTHLQDIFLTASDWDRRSRFFSYTYWCVRSPEKALVLVRWADAKIGRTLAHIIYACSNEQPAPPRR